MYLIPGRPAPKLAHIPLDAISASSSSSIATATPKSIQKEVIKQTPHNSLTNKFATPGSVIQPHGSLDVIKATPYPKRKRKQATDVITTPGPNIVKETPLLRNRPQPRFTEIVKETPIKGNSYYTHLAGSTPAFDDFDNLDDFDDFDDFGDPDDFNTADTAATTSYAASGQLPGKHQDDLDLIIATAKQHPFLDSEDISEDDDRDTEDEDSHENPRKNNPRTSEKIKTKGGLLSFQCMHPNLAGPAKPADDVGTREGNGGSMGTGEGPNERIIKVVSKTS